MFVFPGANAYLLPEEAESLKDIIRGSKSFFLAGYSLQRSPQKESALIALEKAYKLGKEIFFDPSTYTLIRDEKELVDEVVSKSTFLMMNRDEARELTGFTNVDEIIEELKSMKKSACLKLGENGSIVIHKKKVFHAPAFRIDPKDTTGAGDAYDAAFIHLYLKTLDIEKSAIFANWFSAMTITKYGPRTFPSKNEVKNFLTNLFK